MKNVLLVLVMISFNGYAIDNWGRTTEGDLNQNTIQYDIDYFEWRTELGTKYTIVTIPKTNEKYCIKNNGGLTSIPNEYCEQLKKIILKNKKHVKLNFTDKVAKDTEAELNSSNSDNLISSLELEEKLGNYSIFSLKGFSYSYCLKNIIQEFSKGKSTGFGKFQTVEFNTYSRMTSTLVPSSYCKTIKKQLKLENK